MTTGAAGPVPLPLFFAGDALPNPFVLNELWYFRLNGKIEGPYIEQQTALSQLIDALNRLHLWQHLKAELKGKSV